MKAHTLDKLLPTFEKSFSCERELQPVTITADSSAPMGPLQIRRYVRSMRKNREINFSHDFLY